MMIAFHLQISDINDFSETILVFLTAIYALTLFLQQLYIFIHVHAHTESLLAVPTA